MTLRMVLIVPYLIVGVLFLHGPTDMGGTSLLDGPRKLLASDHSEFR